MRFTRQWKKKRGRKTIKRAKKVQKPHFHTRNPSNYGKAEIHMKVGKGQGAAVFMGDFNPRVRIRFFLSRKLQNYVISFIRLCKKGYPEYLGFIKTRWTHASKTFEVKKYWASSCSFHNLISTL